LRAVTPSSISSDKHNYRTQSDDLKVVSRAATGVLGPDVHRLASLHANAKTDAELLKVWLKSHAGGSPHTVRAYARVGARFLGALATAGTDLRKASRTCRPPWTQSDATAKGPL
jgi:hypothetical protein